MTANEEYKGYVTKYHLGELTNEDDINAIRRIFYENSGTGWLDDDMATLLLASNIETVDMLKAQYLKTIVEQNFIIIRQLERISRATGGEPEPRKPTKMEQYLKAKQDAVRRNT